MKLLSVYTPSHRELLDRYMLPSLQDSFDLVSHEYDQDGVGRFLDEDWTRAVMFKCERIIDMIRDNPGEVFVYADVDLRFFAPIRDHLLRAIRDCDIACQQDDPAGNFCTGFFVLRAGPRTLNLWKGVRQGILAEGRDQLCFNRLVRIRDGLRVRHLPTQFFGAGTFSGRLVAGDAIIHIPPAPIMFHANWTLGVRNKVALLDSVGKVVGGGLDAINRNNERYIERNATTRVAADCPPTDRSDMMSPSPSSLPTRVGLELSSVCQLNCPACPTAGGDVGRHLGASFLALGDFRRFLHLHPYVRHIELSNWGEIFLNKDLENILRLAHEHDVALSADNGANLNTLRPGIPEALVRYGLRRLTISIDGASQPTYVQYRVRGDFDRVIGHIREINRYKERYGSEYPRLRWQFVAFGHNQHDIAAARCLAQQLNMEFYVKLSWEDLYTEPFSPVMDRDHIRRESGLEVADRAEFEHRYGRSYIAESCRNLWVMPQIHADGRLLGCMINYRGDYGNVFEQGLEACLRSERLTYARAMVSGRAPPRADIPCTGCKVYQGMRRLGIWMGPDGPLGDPALLQYR